MTTPATTRLFLLPRLVGLAEIAGALFFFFVSLPQADITAPDGPVLLVLGSFVFLAALVGGILLLLGKPWGLFLSMAVQVLQTVRLGADTLLYAIVIGPELTLGFAHSATGDLLLNYSSGFRGLFLFYLLEPHARDTALRLQQENGLFTGVNLVAAFFLWILLSAWKNGLQAAASDPSS